MISTRPSLRPSFRHSCRGAWLVAVLLFVSIAAHAAPTLTLLPGGELPGTFQTNDTETFHLQYTDPAGDPIEKKNAVFVDESLSGGGTTPHTATEIDGTDTAKGVTITWQVNGFAQGGHQGHFEVTPLTGIAIRYPAEAGTFYDFSVDALWVKYTIFAAGLLVCLVFIPFITYFLVRSVNRQGDPARAARGGLLIGILAVCALFIYLFAGVINNPLILYAIPVIGVIAGLIIFFGRR